MTESFKAGGPDWQDRHLDAYLKTGGKIGHLVDFSPEGGSETPCLLFQNIAGESGGKLVPLIYGKDGQDFVVVASHGESSDPAWFSDLKASPEVKFQVLDAKYSGKARIIEGQERQRLFDMMAKLYPPYAEFQKNAECMIPVVVLEPAGTIDRL